MSTDDAAYSWMFRHRHGDSYGNGCRSEVVIWRDEPKAAMRIVFAPSEDRVISDGFYESGAAIRLTDRAYLNLHEPGVVRSLLDQAIQLDWFPVGGERIVDGWTLFDAVAGDAAD